MVTGTVERPQRGLSWWIRQSTPLSIGIAASGAAALALVFLGPAAVLTLNGLVPVETLVEGFKSPELRAVTLAACALGLVALVLGTGSYRRMPTKTSREGALAGAVLGTQALALGAFLLWFAGGDVETFAINYLNFEIIEPQLDDFLTGAKNTVFLAFVGEAIGVVLGLVISVFAVSSRAVVRAPARVYINFFRATPLIWQLIFIGVGLPIGLRLDISTYEAALIALSLNTAAYAAEVFRAGIQSIERGQLEAARGLGMSYAQAMRYAVIPQALRRVIPPLMNEFVILIKDTSLVLVLGLTAEQRDLMTVGDQAVANTFNASFYIATAIGYLAIILPLIRVVNVLERRLRSGLVGVGA